MQIGKLALVTTLIALLAPLAAEAKPYNGDGKSSHRRSLSRAADSERGTSRSCLTAEARSLLSRIENKFGRVEIVSTCRPGARIATSGRRSKHATGEAIDFRVPGRKKQVVNWLISNHGGGGTMTYSDMDHVHVDVGYHFVALNRPSGH